nr:retinol dehydrogenase 8 isoform X1 [Taeniopygia guttata]
MPPPMSRCHHVSRVPPVSPPCPPVSPRCHHVGADPVKRLCPRWGGGDRGATMATPRAVLVTGCSSGIGLALALRLARDPQRRYRVLATMRDLSRRGPLESAAGSLLGDTLLLLPLDVTSATSVAECLRLVPDGRVDVVVHNAGVGLVGPLESASEAEVQRVFDTNVFGVLRLTQALLPQMKQRRSGHIVVVSSVMGLQGVVFNDVYAASKFAVEGLCESLAVQLLHFNVFVSLVEPGPVNSAFEQKLLREVENSEFPGADAETLRCFRQVYLPASRRVFDTFGQSPEHVAQAIAGVIAAPRPPLRTPTTRGFGVLCRFWTIFRQIF